MFQNSIYSLIAKYSAGYPIEELYTDYYDALEYMLQNNVLYYKNNYIIKSLTIHISLSTDTIKSNEEYYQAAP